ncbi:hypothetical protein HYT23_02160 [Candidatus Pacearchaeota archaeon]|nr:hypothetical protein [Candidatus Pacearchaeota archaeon]
MSKTLINILEATTICAMAIALFSGGYCLYKRNTDNIFFKYLIPSSIILTAASGLASETIKEMA